MSDKIFTKDEWNEELEKIACFIEGIEGESNRSKTPGVDQLIHNITQIYTSHIRSRRQD